jgi:sulfite reductase (ferredoxin)
MSNVNVEQVKLESHGLRGPLEADLENSDGFLSEAGKVLIKFHGSYEQTNRDQRGAAAANKEYSFMIRSKLPGGRLTADQYLAHDDIADQFGNSTLRITTRQGIQFHGVIKSNLRNTLRALNHKLVTTFGACGDVVRNVMCCPAPTADPQRLIVQKLADALSDATLPRTRAYHQIWIDGDAMVQDEADKLYGQTYLPRKFKTAIAFAGDNCVDIFTNDAGLIALFDDKNQLIGFNVVAGGGMGVTHNNEETFARLADVVGFVEPDQALDVIKAIVTVHRDFGDRTNRKHARLKYVLHEWGLEKFRAELQTRVPFPVQDPRPMPAFVVEDHLGWNEAGDGTWYVGLPIDSGRIADFGANRMRSGIREIVRRLNTSVRLTAQQNILLADIRPEDKATVDALLSEYGITTVDKITGLRRNSLACPAMPTCGLAITEAERALPHVVEEIEGVLEETGLIQEPIVMRMTGCPNGCARPYVAELAFVGRSLNKYVIYLGGNVTGTRLARPFLDVIPIDKLAVTLKPVFEHFRDERGAGEAFGDYCDRVGFDYLKQFTSAPEKRART